MFNSTFKEAGSNQDMNRAHPQPALRAAVIGAHFGDEGKGVLTDALVASQEVPPLVVRFNGGAQAGHTVVTPEGRRHVFGHLGSGTLAGAPTLLSRFFVSNPMLLAKEWEDLADLDPVVFADPKGLVTTPWDMLVNQALERARGAHRHGSCGVGFNETITRSEDPAFCLRVEDLAQAALLEEKLEGIRDIYLPRRLETLGLVPDATFQSLLASPELRADYLRACASFTRRVQVRPEAELLAQAQDLVFEGAQGLLLDECHPWFPHVTRSRTGLPNVLALAREAGLDHLDVVYVSRWYLTRHGAGPFPSELPGKPSPAIQDPTNQPNDWQGTLRFGLLDLDLLRSTIHADLAAAQDFPVAAHLALTCLDQAGPRLPILEAPGQHRNVPTSAFPSFAAEALELPLAYVGSGAVRNQPLRKPA